MEPEKEQDRRRTGLIVAVAAVLVVLVAILGFMLFKLFYTPPARTQAPEQSVQAEAEPLEQGSPEAPAQTPAGDELFAPVDPESPAVPRAEEHLYGQLQLFYDKDTLVQTSEDPKTQIALLPEGADELPRLDGQCLDAPGLSEEQRVRLAAGLVQAYYTDPPATESVTVTPDPALPSAYRLEAPALEEAPALTARVRFLAAGTELWYLVLLCPAGEEAPAALVDAYESAAIA